MNNFKFFTILQLIGFYFVYCECNLEEFYRWKQVTYEGLPIDRVVENSSKPFLNLYNIVPRSATHYKGKLIITVPRIAPGIPSTLNYVPDNLPVGSSPSLRPYPDFKTNELHSELEADENRVISIFRPRIDDCGRLWFVDTGALEENGKITKQVQRPSVWVIDLNTDKKVRRFEIPTTLGEIGRGMISLKVDVDKNKCDQAYAYIPHILQQKLYVYSLENNRMWTFSHPYLKYELELTKYDVAGFKYQWLDALFSVTLGRRGSDGYRKAFFHPMASNSEFAVSTKILQNETLAANIDLFLSDFVKMGERGTKMQSSMHDFDEKTGVIFYALVSKNAISCWNPNTRLTPETHHIIAQNDDTMNYPADLNVDSDGTLWSVTNTMPKYIYGKLDSKEFNFRVWKGNTETLIKDTVCEPNKFIPEST